MNSTISQGLSGPYRWLDEREVTIDRASSDEIIEVRDCDGVRRFCVPASWADEDILRAVRVANIAYRDGFVAGKRVALDDIREALGLPRE